MMRPWQNGPDMNMIPSVVHSDDFARSHPSTFLVYETYVINRAALGGRPGMEALGDCYSLVSLLESTAREGVVLV